MQARSIATRAAMLGRAAILAPTLLAASCIVEPPPQEPVDAGASEFAVRGSATGLLGPVALELRIDGDSELLSVTGDGAFSFATRLAAGASYTVLLGNPDAPCTLRNQAGVIAGADAAIELTCTGPALASVVVSGIAPAVTLAPDTTDYVVDLPLSQPAVTLTATEATAGDTLTIAGVPVASGTPSA
ncbi:MAG TPA: integrin, partial [Haliangium sp.]|nr:integrin [Haliangium sp.]